MLTFNVNNDGVMQFQQFATDSEVVVVELEGSHREEIARISPGDMVMLVNLYKYIKDNDIQNDFINPSGKNKED